MSITSDKKAIFDSVTSINSLSDSLSTINKLDDLLNRFNLPNDTNTKDIIPFLIQLLTTLTSVNEVQLLVKKIITTSTLEFNNLIKQLLKSQASVLGAIGDVSSQVGSQISSSQSNLSSAVSIATSNVTSSVNSQVSNLNNSTGNLGVNTNISVNTQQSLGAINLTNKPQDISMTMQQIDPFGNLKVRGSTNIVHNYNLKIGGQIYNGLSNVLDKNTYSDSLYSYTFDATGKISLKSTSNTITKFELVNKIIDGTDFIDGNIIYSEIINLLFGSLYNIGNESSNKILAKETFNKQLTNIINSDDVNDTVFTLSTQDMSNLQNSIDKKTYGTSFDFDCTELNVFLTDKDVSDILNSQDPLLSLNSRVNGNIVSNDLNVKYTVDATKSKMEKFLKKDQSLQSSTGNKQGVDNKLNNDIIKALSFIIIKNAITSPQYLMINNILDSYIKGVSVSTQPTNFQDIMKQNSFVLLCIIKTLKKKVTELIYNYLTKIIKKKLTPIIISMIKEKARSYLAILQGLGGF
jgi:hypothetical protein